MVNYNYAACSNPIDINCLTVFSENTTCAAVTQLTPVSHLTRVICKTSKHILHINYPLQRPNHTHTHVRCTIQLDLHKIHTSMKLPIYSVSEKSLGACERKVLHPAGSGDAPHIKYFGWHKWHLCHVVPSLSNPALSAKYCTFIHVTSTVRPFLLPISIQGLHADPVYLYLYVLRSGTA